MANDKNPDGVLYDPKEKVIRKPLQAYSADVMLSNRKGFGPFRSYFKKTA
jgi:hypothetical protein